MDTLDTIALPHLKATLQILEFTNTNCNKLDRLRDRLDKIVKTLKRVIGDNVFEPSPGNDRVVRDLLTGILALEKELIISFDSPDEEYKARFVKEMIRRAVEAKSDNESRRICSNLLGALSVTAADLVAVELDTDDERYRTGIVLHSIYRENVGDSIAKRRRAKGLTQEQLALTSGVSQGTISRLEKGRCAYNSNLLRKIADGLGVPVSELDPGLRD
ncbi:MAG: helix-turn-helix domain-containing protein [Planctomycetaceae bacterium]|jgi:DNA-binding XRE family transcriptional regulator